MKAQYGYAAVILVSLTVLAVGIFDISAGHWNRGVPLVVVGALGFVWAFRGYLRHGQPSSQKESKPGEVTCPECESLQTDREAKMQRDGSETYHWRCFNCDHTWE